MGESLEQDLDVRFTYHAPAPGQAERYRQIRDKAKALAEFICASCPVSRERALAVTHLEQAMMWANAAIARRE